MKTSKVLLLGLGWGLMTAGGVRGQEAVAIEGRVVTALGIERQGEMIGNVRLVFQIIEADGFEETDQAISDVVSELRGLFRFEGYRLLDTSVLQTTTGSGIVRQRLALPRQIIGQQRGLVHNQTYLIEAWVQQAAQPEVLRVEVNLRDADRERMADNGQWRSPEILNVSVNVRDGQTVVLGSARDEAEAGAIILVMRAEFDPE